MPRNNEFAVYRSPRRYRRYGRWQWLLAIVAIVGAFLAAAPPPIAAEPPPPPAACGTVVAPAGFADVTGGAHAVAVDCILWWGITLGQTPTMYGPSTPVTRAQMATFIARLILESGGILPSGTDAFPDDDDLPHEATINSLAAVGLINGRADGTYGPNEVVRRDQMASFISRAYAFRSGHQLSEGHDAFEDDGHSVHQDNINRLAAVGIVGGLTASQYGPANAVRRDQMASFLSRSLNLLVTQGHTEARSMPAVPRQDTDQATRMYFLASNGGRAELSGTCSLDVPGGVMSRDGWITVQHLLSPPSSSGNLAASTRTCDSKIHVPWDQSKAVRIGFPAERPMDPNDVGLDNIIVVHYLADRGTWRFEPVTFIDFTRQWIYADVHELSIWDYFNPENVAKIAEVLEAAENCRWGFGGGLAVGAAVSTTVAGLVVAPYLPIAGCIIAVGVGLKVDIPPGLPDFSERPPPPDSDVGVISPLAANHRAPLPEATPVSTPTTATVRLSQGPAGPAGYRYAISLAGFSSNSSVSVTCHDSVDPGGFYGFTMATNGSGAAYTESQCYSADGPDHWVRVQDIESNRVAWGSGGGGGGTTPPPPSAAISLTMGGAAPAGYWYSMTLAGFAPGSSVTVTCRDSVDPDGFYSQTFTINDGGSASDSTLCYSADGPDHWITGGGVESNHVSWGRGASPPPPSPAASITLARGGTAPAGYWYSVFLSGFTPGSAVSVTCRDSVDAGGFYTQTLGINASGQAADSTLCYSGDGPDHWVTGSGVESNHVGW